MISQLEDRLSNGFQFMELNQRKWFMKTNGTIFALSYTENKDALVVLYADTVMNAAIQIYSTSDPISLDQSQDSINMQLSEIIMTI